MTPKELYETRKAERKARRERLDHQSDDTEGRLEDIIGIMDRFVTAVEIYVQSQVDINEYDERGGPF